MYTEPDRVRLGYVSQNRYTLHGFLHILFKKGLPSIDSISNDIFILKIKFECGTPAKKVTFQCHRKSKNSEFHRRLCVCGSPSRNVLIFLLDCEMKITHVTAVTSVFQILFVLRVMFCVLVRLRYASSFQDTFQPYHMFFYFKFVIRQIDRSGKLESSVFYFVSQKKLLYTCTCNPFILLARRNCFC